MAFDFCNLFTNLSPGKMLYSGMQYTYNYYFCLTIVLETLTTRNLQWWNCAWWNWAKLIFHSNIAV